MLRRFLVSTPTILNTVTMFKSFIEPEDLPHMAPSARTPPNWMSSEIRESDTAQVFACSLYH
jgi:hypothetical protein